VIFHQRAAKNRRKPGGPARTHGAWSAAGGNFGIALPQEAGSVQTAGDVSRRQIVDLPEVMVPVVTEYQRPKRAWEETADAVEAPYTELDIMPGLATEIDNPAARVDEPLGSFRVSVHADTVGDRRTVRRWMSVSRAGRQVALAGRRIRRWWSAWAAMAPKWEGTAAWQRLAGEQAGPQWISSETMIRAGEV
jgi:hypothetical protein